MSYEYECAISGVKAPGIHESDEELDDLPLGWTRITIQRRLPNPEYVALQQVKSATVEGVLLQVQEEHRAEQRPFVTLQVEAQFRALQNDTPPFLVDVQDVLFISESSDVNEALNDVRQQLGLDPVPSYEETAKMLLGGGASEEDAG